MFFDKAISIRFTAWELKLLKQVAFLREETISQYIRSCIIKQAKHEREEILRRMELYKLQDARNE